MTYLNDQNKHWLVSKLGQEGYKGMGDQDIDETQQVKLDCDIYFTYTMLRGSDKKNYRANDPKIYRLILTND